MPSIHDYQGLPGEPDPQNYNKDEDYRQDHSKWHESKAKGKSTSAMPKNVTAHLKKEAKLSDSERKAMYEEGRQAGKAEAHEKLGPQFRTKKPMSARVFLTGMKRGVRHKAYRPPSHSIAKAVRTKPTRSR